MMLLSATPSPFLRTRMEISFLTLLCLTFDNFVRIYMSYLLHFFLSKYSIKSINQSDTDRQSLRVMRTTADVE